MKNQILLYTLLISIAAYDNCCAQQYAVSSNRNPYYSETITPKTDDKVNKPTNKKIIRYHVEETVTLKFGGHKRIYDVSNSNMIETYDLGPNGKRIITPVYGDANESEDKITNTTTNSAINESSSKTKFIDKNYNSLNTKIAKSTRADKSKKPNSNLLKISNNEIEKEKEKPIQQLVQPQETVLKQNNILTNINKEQKLESAESPKSQKNYTHYIDVMKVYERVVNKGYESEPMLKKMGNSYYLNNNFEKAAKCYSKLLNITTNLEPEIYYRYSIILKSMGEIKKSEEYLKKFNEMTKED